MNRKATRRSSGIEGSCRRCFEGRSRRARKYGLLLLTVLLLQATVVAASPAQAEVSEFETANDRLLNYKRVVVELDSAAVIGIVWKSVRGGELIIETTDTTIGSDKFQTQSPGHKSVGEIVLRGAMTDKRAALTAWIEAPSQGKEWKRELTLTELLSVDDGVKASIHYDGVPRLYCLIRSAEQERPLAKPGWLVITFTC